MGNSGISQGTHPRDPKKGGILGREEIPKIPSPKNREILGKTKGILGDFREEMPRIPGKTEFWEEGIAG